MYLGLILPSQRPLRALCVPGVDDAAAAAVVVVHRLQHAPHPLLWPHQLQQENEI